MKNEGDNSILNNLRCPDCLGAFIQNEKTPQCDSCGAQYHISEGIPDLRKDRSSYYCEFPKGDIEQFLADSKVDLEGTVRAYLRNKQLPPKLGEYIMGSGRAGWTFLLPISAKSRVLDLGCGWGTLAYGLANRADEVVALDSTLERMRLLHNRSVLDGLRNLKTVCAGDGTHLPFANDSFDIVIVNGVLEWVPSGLAGNPGELQRAFLREVRRVLKPSGTLLLGIENRYAWKTWFRNPDGHTGLRFVPWLPRFLATMYSKVTGKGEYRNWLYSEKQYERLLSNEGFDSSSFVVPLPGYHHPVWMVPLTQPKKIAKRVRRSVRSPIMKTLQYVKGRLTAMFPDAFTIIASSELKKPNFLDRLLRHLNELDISGWEDIPQECAEYRINGEMGIVTILLQKNGSGNVIKLPLHSRAIIELEHEVTFFQESPKQLSNLLPRVISKGNFDAQEYFVYSFLPGSSGEGFRIEDGRLSKVLNSAVQLLVTFDNEKDLTNASSQLANIEQKVLSLASSESQRNCVNNAVKRCQGFIETISDDGWILGHGDFKLANCILAKDSLSIQGVIDWGGWSKRELPGYDLAFLLTDIKWRFGSSLEESIRLWRDDLPAESWAIQAIDHFNLATNRNIGDKEWRAIMAWQWLKRLAPLADLVECKRFDYNYLNRMFDVYAD
ncbi:methyltransferase domain-containing protein [bacterium]|nr:methyltransferase domain-containing protein [bacterium]